MIEAKKRVHTARLVVGKKTASHTGGKLVYRMGRTTENARMFQFNVLLARERDAVLVFSFRLQFLFEIYPNHVGIGSIGSIGIIHPWLVVMLAKMAKKGYFGYSVAWG